MKKILIILFLANNALAQFCYNQQEIPASTPSGNFINNGDSTVTDKTTGLMWSHCYLGHSGNQCQDGGTGSNNYPTKLTWQAALSAAQNSSLGGYSNWRLPNIKELSSIFEQACIAPAINSDVFPHVPETRSYTWASSKHNLFDDQSYVVNFYNGITYSDTRTTENYVRFVRDQ